MVPAADDSVFHLPYLLFGLFQQGDGLWLFWRCPATYFMGIIYQGRRAPGPDLDFILWQKLYTAILYKDRWGLDTFWFFGPVPWNGLVCPAQSAYYRFSGL